MTHPRPRYVAVAVTACIVTLSTGCGSQPKDGQDGAPGATAPLPAAATAIAFESVVYRDGTGTVTTPAFSTSAANEVLLAFVGSDGPSAGTQTVTVSGAGLTWTRLARANARAGTSEIWRAVAAAPVTNVTVRSRQSASVYDQSLTVVALKGASGTGSVATASAAAGAPSVSLTSSAAGAWVFAVGNDWDRAVARTLGAGQTMVHEWTDTRVGDDFWVQRLAAPTAAAGVTVTMNATAPTNDRWNLAAVEVVPAAAVPAPAPTFSPSPGTFTAPQAVTLSDSAAGATIYFTTDGSDPTTSSSVYAAPLPVSATTTIRAFATAPGLAPSAVATGQYVIQAPAALAISPAAATAPPGGSVTFSATGGSGTGYAWALLVNSSGGSIGPASGDYHAGRAGGVTDVVQLVDSAGGVATASVSVGPGVTIAPSSASTSPGGQVVFAASGGSGAGFAWRLAVNASGGSVDAGGRYLAGPVGGVVDLVQATDSLGNSASATVTVAAPAPAPTFSPAPGTFAAPQAVTLSDSAAGATIYFTTDGSDPTTSSSVYAAPVPVSATTTIRAFATAPGLAPSAVVTGQYVIQAPAALAISPAAATAPPGGSVTFSATGGSGTGYAWALLLNSSGGSIGPASGDYHAGPAGGVTDVVQVLDSLGHSATATVTVTAAAVLALDAVTYRDGSGTATTPAFSTSAANEVLLAFVGSDGPSTGTQTVTVSGAGLTWSRVARANAQAGTSEIWRAVAPAPLAGATVRSVQSASGYDQSLTVVALTGASGTGGAATASMGSGAPSVSLTSSAAGSWVFAVGNDWDRAIARTLGAGQAMVHEWTDTRVGDDFWVQRLATPTAAAGVAVTMTVTAPTTDRWNLAAVEVLPGQVAPVQRFALSGTISPAAGGSGATVTLSGAASATTTADGAGAFLFPGLTSGSYLVTPTKPGYSFTPASQSVTVNGADVAGVNFTAQSQGPTANLTVDGARSFQTIDGMGTNINVESWKGGALMPALDYFVDVNGASLLRVVRDPMDWVSSESDIAGLHAKDAATLARVYETPAMQDLWSTIEYLNQKGLGGSQLLLDFMGWTPRWIGGSGQKGVPSSITAGKEPALATMIASLVHYGRVVRGLDFTNLGPMNEPDLGGLEGPAVGAAQYTTVLAALANELTWFGLDDVRIVGPDTLGSKDDYIARMMADGTVTSRVDHLAFHTYSGPTSPGPSYPGKNYWLTETAVWCSTCDQDGAPTGGEWAFARDNGALLLQDVANGLPAILVWEGYDSYWYHHDAYSTWGLLDYDRATGVYAPRKRFYVNSQLTRFIRPGMKRVALSTSVSQVTALAFHDAATGRVSIVGQNTAGSPVTLNGLLGGIATTVSSLAVYQTDSGSMNLQRGADVPVTGSTFTVTIPADTFFSLASW